MVLLRTDFLDFGLNDDANQASFSVEGNNRTSKNADFWRLILDDGFRTEIPVFSHMQKGKTTINKNVVEIVYPTLLSAYGDTYNISFCVTVETENGLLKFTPHIENNEEGVRVNECFCPLADFTKICGDENEKEKDVIYLPNGLGSRTENPWRVLQGLATNYYYHDENEVFWHLSYPRACMGWFGVQSGNRFLYIARYDEKLRYCFLTVRQKIHSNPSDMMLGIDHFPMARTGERLTLPPTVIGLLDGDWREGARLYRAWAEKTFYKVPERAPWVKDLTGWQRIILRSQYGEDYFKAEDIPELYRIGAKYGIHTLFLFGWWKEGMDANYPDYNEPYPGAFEKLRESFRKVRELGGRIILECNCHFMDPKNPYYKQFGDEVKILDINGNEVRPAFVYPGYGEFRATYGARQFPLCCSATERWREQVLSQLRLMNELEPDCLFADCYGGAPHQPCFNDRHEHGARVDEDWSYKRRFFEEAEEYCKRNGKVLATEIVTDIAASYNQFVHGLINVDFKIKGDSFPQLFRYTFPEVITTTRGIRDEEGDFAKRFKYALVMGLRLDAELYVCRTHLDSAPEYAKAVGEYTSFLNKYREFMMDGTFTVLDTSALPYYIKRGEYYNAAGDKVLRVLYNASERAADVCGVTLSSDEIRFDIFDIKEYQR